MSTPTAGSKGPSVPSGLPGSTPVQPRPAAQKTQERRRALIISCVMLVVAALTAVVVIAAESPTSVHALNSPQTATVMPNIDFRTAKITNEPDSQGCWQQIFDNQTGRMTRSPQPCETTAYDSNGAPIPLGTIHRLDAISKSFSGH